MRLVAATAIAVVLVGCGAADRPPRSESPVAPQAAATIEQLTPYYGSYSTANGDILVVARMGWFLDMKTSAYRTIYAQRPPAAFSIGCRFQVPLPKCADLVFAADTVSVRDSSRGVTIGHRVHYKQAEVMIPAAGAALAGTITEPEGAAGRGGIVIIHGSEPGQRYFYDIWVALYASLGLAVLTYDKRGHGASGGTYPGEFPTEDALKIYADDAAAAVKLLARWPGVDPARVGFHGGSQGGWTVPLAMSRHGGVAFAVLASAPATTVDQTDVWAGFSGGGAAMPTETEEQMLAEVRATHTGYDPTRAIQGMSAPALWLLGKNDRTVPTAVCAEILSGMHKANFTIELLPTGHGLLVNPTGLLAGDDQSPGLAPDLIPTIGTWLRANSITS
jgi:dienelactone hydrolase